jgi:hypothetical protein
MKVNSIVIISILFIALIVGAVLYSHYGFNIPYFVDNKQTNNTSSLNFSNNTNQSTIIDFNNSITIPPNDYVINNINWSSYPNLKTGYVYLAQVCEPNDIVPHKFIGVQILTEIKETKNTTIIKEQLGSVAKETRQLYGPNSAICILGTDNGVVAWTVTMRVYDDSVYY